MENVLTITNLKQNIIEFNAGVEGLNDNDMAVRLVIEAAGVNFEFQAKRLKDTLWEVIIPPLPMLEKTAYPFHMDVISEGYFFNPLKGTMNIVGTHEIYVTDPRNKSIPAKDIEELPIKHSAKPEAEVEETEEKISPKILKPIRPKMDTPKEHDIAGVAARMQALAQQDKEKVTLESKEPEEKVIEKKAPPVVKKSKVKKLSVGSKKAEVVENIIEKAKKKAKQTISAPAVLKVEPVTEEKAEAVEDIKLEPTVTTFEDALEKVSKPIPKKARPIRKRRKAKPKAGTIKKITENKEIISKPEDEVKLEATNEEKVKDILDESETVEETKKVITHPIKKKGVTYH